MWTENFQLFMLDLGKGRSTRNQIANICWVIEKARELQKNIYFCFIYYTKAFDLWITTNCGSEYQTTLPISWETCRQDKEQQLTGHGTTPKNWCFQNVVLEKTLESPLDSKNKPVNPKGNQPWIFIGRTDAEAEAPILWPPDVKSRLIGKDSDDGKHWGQEEKGVTEDEMFRWHHLLNGHEFEQTLGDSEGQGSLVCCMQSMGLQRVRHDLGNEQYSYHSWKHVL